MPIDRIVLCNFRWRKPREQLESALKSFKIKVNNTVNLHTIYENKR